MSASLEAWHVDGTGDRQLRWWRNLGLIPQPCDHELRITPHVDGSVEVVFDSDHRRANRDRAVRLDASGHGLLVEGQELPVVDVQTVQFASVVLSIPEAGDQPADPAPNHDRVWYFEDGTQIVSDDSSQTRAFARTGRYFVTAIDYDKQRASREPRRPLRST